MQDTFQLWSVIFVGGKWGARVGSTNVYYVSSKKYIYSFTLVQ